MTFALLTVSRWRPPRPHANYSRSGHARPKDIKRLAVLLRASGTPIMPLGPIPTDTAIGQYHISSAIGAVLLGLEGCAHILAAVTREEHTGGIPSVESTIEAIAAARVAARVIDLDQLDDDESDQSIVNARSNGSLHSGQAQWRL
ncbi:phosphomethylpyrimidine synthase ThiC [Janthinobacterium sp. GMG2]|uniref:phosphomethylpyrimidine synthase ThiC n=1 Tax=Janthinobacterium sp. GMG2 TaxID=3096606 RepID=UPI0039B6F1CF